MEQLSKQRRLLFYMKGSRRLGKEGNIQKARLRNSRDMQPKQPEVSTNPRPQPLHLAPPDVTSRAATQVNRKVQLPDLCVCWRWRWVRGRGRVGPGAG